MRWNISVASCLRASSTLSAGEEDQPAHRPVRRESRSRGRWRRRAGHVRAPRACRCHPQGWHTAGWRPMCDAAECREGREARCKMARPHRGARLTRVPLHRLPQVGLPEGGPLRILLRQAGMRCWRKEGRDARTAAPACSSGGGTQAAAAAAGRQQAHLHLQDRQRLLSAWGISGARM